MIDIATGLISVAKAAINTDDVDEVATRRAVSACYYAVYHALAKAFADALLGADEDSRPNNAWIEVYRGLDHHMCAEACKLAIARGVGFPEPLINVADCFTMLQKHRHTADYDPKPFAEGSRARDYLATAEECVAAIRECPDNDIKAFAAWVLITSKGAKSARTLRHPEEKARANPKTKPKSLKSARKHRKARHAKEPY